MSRSERHFRSTEIAKARRSSDPEAGPLAEMQLAHEILDPSYFEVEADLTTMAYLNYRYMTPYQRTEYFANEYQKWYAVMQKKGYGRVGRRAAKPYLAMWKDLQVAQFWRARQHADALGMPYGRYIVATMDRAIDVWERLPSPNQLYDPDMVKHAEGVRDELRSHNMIELLPREECDPRFFAENYVGDPVQSAALDAIELNIRKAGVDGPSRLVHYMRERRTISEAEARRRLGDELVDAALAERQRNSARADHVLDQGPANTPGCFGYNTQRSGCDTCPMVAACIDRADKLKSNLRAKHGTTELRALKIKAGNRERQQRSRDRKRQGMTMTLQEEKRILREAGDPKAIKKREDAKKRRDDKKAKRIGKPKAPGDSNDNIKPEGVGKL